MHPFIAQGWFFLPPWVHVVAIVKRFDDGEVPVDTDAAEMQGAHLCLFLLF